MAAYPFRIVNVFTHADGPLTGNPLCVFEHAQGLDTATLQALARQFNLSETTFLFPSDTADARVRIFTPNYEMAFAGHPTLGSAHVCRALGMGGDSLVLEMEAGLIPVCAAGNRWTLSAPAATWREFDSPKGILADALGFAADDIGERPLWVKAGKEQLIVPLTSLDALRRAAPRADAFTGMRNEDGQSMAYLFAAAGVDRTVARFFFPQGAAMVEDPATGSATANFGGWCIAMQRPLPSSYQILQGDQIARPSFLYLDIDPEAQIRVSGEVLELAAGVVTLPADAARADPAQPTGGGTAAGPEGNAPWLMTS